MDAQRKRRFVRRPSPALVIACIGLAVALSGTSYAVTALPKKSVGTAQLKANAVTSAKVRNGALKAVDFAAGQLPAGERGPQGPQGPAGPTGETGATGPRGPSFGDAKYANEVAITSCGSNNSAVAYTVTLAEPARIFASATGTYQRTDPGPDDPSMWIQLVNGAGTVVASTHRIIDHDVPAANNVVLTTSGVLRSTSAGLVGFTVPAGTYTLRLELNNFGLCAGTGTYRTVELSHIVLGAG
jgi:hypothetical protein